MYLGNTEIGKAYLGNNLVFQKGGQPQPTTQIPYIRGGHNGSYINTGVNPDNTTRVIVWARNFNPLGEFLFGARDAEMTQRFAVLHPGGADVDRIRVDFGSNSQTYVDAATTRYSSGYHKYELNGNQFYVDDVLLATCPSATFECAFPMFIFGYNAAGTRAGIPPYPIDICACKIYKSGTLVRDYTAVNTPSAGLYDAISQTLFTNAGSGSFTYGTFNPNAYTPLEYIECDKQQYFDTGAYGSDNINLVAKFRMTSSDKEFSRLFGCRNKGDTIMCELMIGNTSVANRNYYMRYSGGPNTVYNSASQTGNDLVFTAIKNAFALYKDNTRLGTATGATGSFTTPQTIYIGASNCNGDPQLEYAFYGRIYHLTLDEHHSYIPAKVNNVAGMYDTYNDVFKSSISGVPFIAGPTL